MRVIVRVTCLLGILIALGTARAENSNTLPPILRNVGIEQKLDQQVPLEIVFRDETGKNAQLKEFFGEKPVILSLVYFDCPMLCTTVENALLDSLRSLKFSVGEQFSVLTVSFDPKDKPEIAKAKKAIYAGLYGRRNAAQGWHFLTGDETSIERLTQAVGFRYSYDREVRQYAHASGIIVLTPQGKVSRYFYGIQYPPGDLRLSLVEASAGRIGSRVDELLLFCCQYNPVTGKYDLMISRILKIGAAITVFTIAGLILALSRSRRPAPA